MVHVQRGSSPTKENENGRKASDDAARKEDSSESHAGHATSGAPGLDAMQGAPTEKSLSRRDNHCVIRNIADHPPPPLPGRSGGRWTGTTSGYREPVPGKNTTRGTRPGYRFLAETESPRAPDSQTPRLPASGPVQVFGTPYSACRGGRLVAHGNKAIAKTLRKSLEVPLVFPPTFVAESTGYSTAERRRD